MYDQTSRINTFFPISPFLAWFFVSLFISVVSCSHSPSAEKYGFVTLLGHDTIAVESVTRQGNILTSDDVDRFPRVRVRHTVIKLDPDGSIRHLEMNIHTPSELAEKRERKVIADVVDNKVNLSKKDRTGTLNRAFATDSAIVVAHVPQMYSLYELYFVAARKHAAESELPAGSSVKMRQFYIDREFDRFPLGRATVKLLDNGKLGIRHDWLAGEGEATMDSSGRLLNYSGARTTYDVEVKRLSSPPDVKAIAQRFEAIEAKAGNVKSLSVRDTLRAQIGNTIFTVDYSRPLRRGRSLLGKVIPYDRVWRTGANAATQFTTSAPINLGGIHVPAGTYTLWTVPHTSGVDLVVNGQTGQWGTEYNSSRNLGEARMITQSLPVPVEEFTFSIVPGEDKRHGTLVMEWGSFRWTAPIEVQ